MRRLTLALGGSAAALAGCGLESPATTLAPRSDFGWISHTIFLQILAWDVAIFLVVQILLLVAVFRFRERDPKAVPRQVPGNAKFELAWTIIPAVILTFIAFPTVAAIFRSQGPVPDGALRVRVVGHQWWWEFQYPDLGIATATDLHLPAGRPVSLEISAADVIHSFWVPTLGGKRDALPGGLTRIVLTADPPKRADAPDEYYGQCAEYCGPSHANMRHWAIVHVPESFAAWVAKQQAAPVEPEDGSAAAAGLKIYQQGACVGCHTIRGVSGGQLGPDLTHFASRRSIAGGILANTPENLARWLRNPPAVKPGSLMPDLQLTDEQVAALVAYLGALR